MPNLRLAHVAFAATATVGAIQCALDYPQLPARVASHFGASGAANGWMTKQAFFAVYAAIVVVCALVGFLAPRRIEKTSPARINLPNKDYWLAPERREATFAYFRTSFAWYACAFLFMLVLAMGLAIQANFASPPRMAGGSALTLVGAFILFNLLWVLSLFRRFSSPR
jgi:uncharacterized membrane protein